MVGKMEQDVAGVPLCPGKVKGKGKCSLNCCFFGGKRGTVEFTQEFVQFLIYCVVVFDILVQKKG